MLSSAHSLLIVAVQPALPSHARVFSHLNSLGFDVTMIPAAAPEELRQALTHSPHLVFSGLDHPSIAYPAILDILSGVEVPPPLVILCSAAEEEQAIRAVLDGASDYILYEHTGRIALVAARALQRNARRGATTGVLRARAELALQESEQRYRTLFDTMPSGMIQLDRDARVLNANPAALRILGVNLDELREHVFPDPRWKNIHEDGSDFPVEDRPALVALRTGQVVSGVVMGIFNPVEQRYRWLLTTATPLFLPGETAPYQVYTLFADITELRQAEESLRQTNDLLNAIIQASPLGISALDNQGRITLWSPAAERLFGWTEAEVLGGELPTVPEEMKDEVRRQILEEMAGVVRTGLENTRRRKDGSLVEIRLSTATLHDPRGSITGSMATYEDVTERKRTEQALRDSQERNQVLASATFEGIVISEKGRILEVNQQIAQMVGYLPEEMLGTQVGDFIYPEDRARVLENVLNERDSLTEYRLLRKDGRVLWAEARARMTDYQGRRVRFAAVRDVTERKRAEEEILRQVRRLSVLREIDQSILSARDLHETLSLLVELVTGVLGVDAANILLYDPRGQTLRVAVEKGFTADWIWLSGVPLDETHAGRVALSRQLEFIPDLALYDDRLTQRISQIGENFTSYIAVPLVAKDQLKAVLQLFQRRRLDPDEDWFSFLRALVDQAAIAIDNAQLFQEQVQANRELVEAYDKTIEGWSGALDLRDKETEGHSRRVTELTIQLATRLGVPSDQLPHLKRGAQLHDIGKMGVPDGILHKEGPLTPEEWKIMQRHPVYAAQLLSPIRFLGPALEIPYSHHERWDGGGYPEGMQGDEIPLAARIFAVVDVWDALTSDRPYRPGWSRKAALEYIRQQSGKQFEPRVTAAFLEMVGEESGQRSAVSHQPES